MENRSAPELPEFPFRKTLLFWKKIIFQSCNTLRHAKKPKNRISNTTGNGNIIPVYPEITSGNQYHNLR